jgi:hypothetical protein
MDVQGLGRHGESSSGSGIEFISHGDVALSVALSDALRKMKVMAFFY